MSQELQLIIDKVNEMIAELEGMNVEIEDFENPNDWKLAGLEWDKKTDKVWFKVREMEVVK